MQLFTSISLVILYIAYYFLYALDGVLLIDALYSWFDMQYNSPVHRAVDRIAEVFIGPIRKLINRINSARYSRFDWSFLVAVILVMVLQRIVVVLISVLSGAI